MWQFFCEKLVMFKKSISREAIFIPLLMLTAMWFGFFLQNNGFFEYCNGAIIPLSPDGLKGVVLSPFLHGDRSHLIGNSLPMLVLLFLLFQFYPKIAKRIFVIGWIASGFLVWLLPPIDIATGETYYSCIIGASGIVYVLAFFLFFSGVFRWNMNLLTVSMVVALYYGGLVWGMMPEELFYNLPEPSRISWQAHLAGAVVGIILALIFRNVSEKKQRFIWQYPNYYSEKDDKLWQEYREKHPEDFMDLPYKKRDEIWERLDELRRKR